ncbi:pancreatic lipase-related protein 3-like isoform X2 [Neocloeon triangulifer]|uniref:pancreatic lipase-related protein 3-like isoform X2 n=1 Tax=Neocloeon triangulifer TaxID=2078957 RepID=UPI00286F97A5|nr:pancreatic lipase-related protein 3-like isoform X2 [Neocloeon triangulifer]
MFVFSIALSAFLYIAAARLAAGTLGEPPPALSEEVAIVAMPPEIPPGNIRRVLDQVLSQFLFKHRQGRKSVCYDVLGCFHVSGKLAHLRSVPDSPERLDTRFYLYRKNPPDAREQRSIGAEDDAEMIDFFNYHKLSLSNFDPEKDTKILLHGYKGRGDGDNAKRIRNAFFDREDVNIFSVDWSNGAKGPNYLRAVANAELVARQLAHLILEMIAMGSNPKQIHIIGFSLGAQVAGMAGAEVQKEGFKIGRITGLDPASFTFERAGLDADKRLDLTDAEFVDVIHTDGSLIWSDGFGILAPVGHVDFYPNGGRDQPGCKDSYVGALTFQLTQNMNSTNLCSHARAVDLFIESLDPSCKFLAYPCPGLRQFERDFTHGNCFTCDGGSCGEMGYRAPLRSGRGPLYLATRATKPYCGQQIRAAVQISPQSKLTRGTMILQLHHESKVTTFELSSSRLGSQTLDMISAGQELSAVTATDAYSISPEKTPILYAALAFRPKTGPAGRITSQQVILDRISITSQEGKWWHFCGRNTTVKYTSKQRSKPLIVKLDGNRC